MKQLNKVLAPIVFCLGVALIGFYYYAGRTPDRTAAIERPAVNAPIIFTPDPVIEAMIALAEIKEDDFVLDLGCGDGRILITAAAKTGCKGVGYDLDPELVEKSRQNAIDQGVDHLVTFEVQDILTLDMSHASVIMMYLLPQLQKEMIPQFQKMKPGSRLVSHDSGIGDIHDLPPEKKTELKLGESDIHFVYRWTVPLQVPDAN